MATFDVNDRESWYFGSMSRVDATDLLMNEKEGGIFLVRDSKTISGDYVLCVREDTKVSHYIINRISAGPSQQFMYRIGDQNFQDLPELLGFYKLHYLDTTPLRRPAKKIFERVICKFDFKAGDSDDLPFRKGEILEVVNKDEEQWWTARNAQGQTGQIPVPYVEKYVEAGGQPLGNRNLNSPQQQNVVDGTFQQQSNHHHNPQQQQSAQHSLKKSNLNRKLPALARVKQARVPNAYDKTALKLEVGDIITVTKMNINGQWEGELKGKSGHFPFPFVEFIDQIEGGGGGNDLNDLDSSSSSTGNGGSRHCGNVNSSLILNNSSSLVDDK